jgi:hypothetical protein
VPAWKGLIKGRKEGRKEEGRKDGQRKEGRKEVSKKGLNEGKE